MASIDAQGVVHVYGRLDDIEVIGGQNVVPGEIERLLESHPRVLEAAVSVVRRPAGDTSLRAYVVRIAADDRDDATDPDGLADELIDLTRSHLSWYKVPTTSSGWTRSRGTATGRSFVGNSARTAVNTPDQVLITSARR
ncbi:hypothetical protein NKH77_52040 [Streptomyces sp. M19]